MGKLSLVNDGLTVKSLILVEPSRNMSSGKTTMNLGYPDYDLAAEQHKIYANTLRSVGVKVYVYPSTNKPDQHFVEDLASVFRSKAGEHIAIVGIPATPERKQEVGYIVEILVEHIPKSNILFVPNPNGATIEFGDVVRFGGNVLIGESTRTNQNGTRLLKALLKKINPEYKVTTLKISEGLHADTSLSPLNSTTLIHDPAMPLPNDFSFKTRTLPHGEGYAASVMIINQNTVVMPVDINHSPNGYTFTLELLNKHYSNVLQVPMSEFHKMDGSLRCLKLALVWDDGNDKTLRSSSATFDRIRNIQRA